MSEAMTPERGPLPPLPLELQDENSEVWKALATYLERRGQFLATEFVDKLFDVMKDYAIEYAAAAEVARLAGQAVWISVDDSLPEPDQWVSILFDHSIGDWYHRNAYKDRPPREVYAAMCRCIDEYEPGKFCAVWEQGQLSSGRALRSFSSDLVTHWMPLPDVALGVIATPSADGADAARYRWLRGATRMIDGSVEGMLTIHAIHDDAPSEIRDDDDATIDAAKSRSVKSTT